MKKDTVYFISDAHFGINIQGEESREERFAKFIEENISSMSSLFIVGDLFDFWIEYKNAIRPDYFNVLCTLKQVTDKNIPVYYLAGNHDFALGSFLKDYIGISIHYGHYETVIQNKKVHLFHGDGLIKSDYGYRILRKILRNPINQYLYKLLHPDIGVGFASRCSGQSRKYRQFPEKNAREYRIHAKEYIEAGNDIVIFGHTHRAEICNIGNGIYCNTGSWLIHYNYASMKNGELSLWSYNAGSSPEKYQQSSWK
ncbi:MAG: UDP-2,3-diacylglucosamine diphosphatase [Fibrobacter sp.]|nr:UDP-2,3-diacylglucosamine diphosphatase [Fibrobacter sp.]